MTKAIKTKFECVSCGMTINLKSVLTTTAKKNKYSFEAPSKCSCGATSEKMRLITFEEMESVIVSPADKKRIEDALTEKGPVSTEE